MSFSHPWLLLLLLIPAALVAFEVMREMPAAPTARGFSDRVSFPFDFGRPRRRAWLSRFITAANTLPPLVLAIVVLILAGPRRMAPPQQERVLTNIEIVLDVSGSMTSTIQGSAPPAAAGSASGLSADDTQFGPTRYTAAMAAIREFCEKRAGDAFGLTIFGSEVIRWMPLTKDLAAIKNATPFLNPAKMPPHMGGTEIGKALKYARAILSQQPTGDRLIILITDGYSSDLDGPAAFEVAQELAAERIVVHAVCIGDEPPPQQLSDVVIPTGGQVFGAGTPNALSGVFTHIDRMQPARLKRKEPESVDYYRPLVLAGLALVGLHGLCLFGWRWTPW